MHIFDTPSALVGVSELRTRLDEVLRLAKRIKIYLGRRQKPVAVILPIGQYEEMEGLLDRVEDMALGFLAKERDHRTKLKDYIPLQEAKKKLRKHKNKKR